MILNLFKEMYFIQILYKEKDFKFIQRNIYFTILFVTIKI